MSKAIKTRNVVKDIKALDKKAALTSSVREAHAKTKDVVERAETSELSYRHGADYAQDKAEQSTRSGAEAAGHGVAKGAKKTTGAARNLHSGTKAARHGSQAASKQAVQHKTARNATTSKQAARGAITSNQVVGKQTGSNTSRAAKGTIKQGAK